MKGTPQGFEASWSVAVQWHLPKGFRPRLLLSSARSLTYLLCRRAGSRPPALHSFLCPAKNFTVFKPATIPTTLGTAGVPSTNTAPVMVLSLMAAGHYISKTH